MSKKTLKTIVTINLFLLLCGCASTVEKEGEVNSSVLEVSKLSDKTIEELTITKDVEKRCLIESAVKTIVYSELLTKENTKEEFLNYYQKKTKKAFFEKMVVEVERVEKMSVFEYKKEMALNKKHFSNNFLFDNIKYCYLKEILMNNINKKDILEGAKNVVLAQNCLLLANIKRDILINRFIKNKTKEQSEKEIFKNFTIPENIRNRVKDEINLIYLLKTKRNIPINKTPKEFRASINEKSVEGFKNCLNY